MIKNLLKFVIDMLFHNFILEFQNDIFCDKKMKNLGKSWFL